jgi:predicted RNA-binding Zn-ribbon protein involved in translation (DUF1610 family)
MELGSPRPPNHHSGDGAKAIERRAIGQRRGPFKINSSCISKFVMRLSRERHSRHPLPVPTAEHPLVQTAEVNFICPHCGSFYEMVRVKALDSVDPQIRCPACTGPLPAREAQFVLKYFLLRKVNGGWRRTPLGAWADGRERFAITAATKQIAMPAAAKGRISRS